MNVYLKLIHGSLMIIVLYVDDLLITRISKKARHTCTLAGGGGGEEVGEQ